MSATTDAQPRSATVPRFRRHLRIELGETGVYLFGEDAVTVLRSRAVAAVCALIDGRRDTAEITAARPAGLGPDQVATVLTALREAGLLVTGPVPTPGGDECALAWWEACGVDLPAGAGPQRVGVAALGIDPGPVLAALAAAGHDATPVSPVAVEPELAGALTVVLCADYLDPVLATVDAAHRAVGAPWLLAKPTGVRTWLGPVFDPASDGGCWSCLAHRLATHRRAEAVVRAELGHDGPVALPIASVPSGAAAFAHLVALEVDKWVAGHRYAGQRAVRVLDTRDLSGEKHELRARPECPACGDPGIVAARSAQPVVLRPAVRVAGSGGGDRTMTPEQVLDRYRHLVGPVTGIVRRIVRPAGAPDFVHAFRSGGNVSRWARDVDALRAGLRTENGGKGLTAVDAEVGALCEAAERHSGTARGDELVVRGSLDGLGDRAVDPRTWMLFDERQYPGREAWNREHSPTSHVPRPFDPGEVLDWTPVWSLTGRRQRLLPTASLYFGPATPSLAADSNGCAAGSSLEDAVLQGILELVERDAVGIWWYNRLTAPEVDLGSFGGLVAEQRDHHARIGRDLWVLDVTTDLGVPVMVAVSRRTGGDGERLMFGFGAHLDPATALRRAVAEVNQLLTAMPADPSRCADPDLRRWLTAAVVADHPHLLPDPAVTPRGRDHYGRCPGGPGTDLRDDVLGLVDLMAQHGMETLVLDQTRPDIGIPVARVVVPGLRSFWARFAPGRLFDVPVRTGARSRRTPYDQLNPLPLFA